ncbi:polyribonucleotide nucleotidyltransferase [Myxococcota bacterium]|nr:polyribonucleotide nucleotidyltransferase [Myxococcota bacterium]MBU1379490.1 polyribonucleotide nucleotidyltransferase [Myxococcota bacterium]MBU1497913.1 polyribonucleotide nucleotidyltransferase [Myxococcota bacterium]
MYFKESVVVNGKEISIETGKIAKQASGSVIVRSGNSMVLVTAVAATKAKEDIDFIPLTVDYQEKSYAAGKIPGNFFRREGKLSEGEILASRLIDRPIRPLFPEGWNFETQIIATVLSHDGENCTYTLSQIGASAALMLSDIPWHGPIAGVQVGRIDGKLIAYPSIKDMVNSDMDINMVASKDAIMMVEGELDNLSEEDLLDAMFFGQDAIKPILDLQEKLTKLAGKIKREISLPEKDTAFEQRVVDVVSDALDRALENTAKLERYAAIDEVKKMAVSEFTADFPEKIKDVQKILEDLKYKKVRSKIVKENKRLDNRTTTEIRQITGETAFLPMAHGSALFTRGETQAIVTCTLGFGMDNQKMDLLTGEEFRSFMLHYNFPPFSVGEARPMRGPGRREIGHGNLAYRALSRVLPKPEDFPYVIRIVSEITESNGSSSMASVCGGSMALMDCGVPVKAPVAGIAMGLIKEGDEFAVLSDILGDEDHLGDMDFKVAGTATGINAVQMDIKIEGINREIMKKALYQAKDGRLHILGKMAEVISESRPDVVEHAPKVTSIMIDTDKIRDVIGPGGKMIRSITETTGAKIDVDDSGRVLIAANNAESAKKAYDFITNLTRDPKIGEYYAGIARRVIDKVGVVVEFLPGSDGLVHISEMDKKFINTIDEVVKVGDTVVVKIIDVERGGKIKLSRKQALDVEESLIIHGI